MRKIEIKLICIGIISALILGEIAMRIYYYTKFSDRTRELDDVALYMNRPAIKFTNKYGIEVEHNSLGFIGKEMSENKGFRILGIGDSITLAGYLAEDQRYLNRLSAILTEKTGRAIEVINAGVGGYNTRQELELLRARGLLVKPNLVIVGVCLNDFYKIGGGPRLRKGLFGGITENYRDGSRARHFDFIYQRSDLYKFTYDFVSNIRRGRLGNRNYLRYLEDYEYAIKPEYLKEWKNSFLEMLSLAEASNIKILFVIFPLESQIVKEEDDSCSALSDFFKENRAYYIDLIGYFKRAAKKSLYRRRDIIHPSSLGHKIAAEAIAGYILENSLI